MQRDLAYQPPAVESLKLDSAGASLAGAAGGGAGGHAASVWGSQLETSLPGQTFEWNGNMYLTNYADEAFEALNTEVAIEEILIDETEPQLSQVEDDESLAYNIQ